MSVAVLRGDARQLPLPDASVDLVITSPPYFGLRAYTDEGYCAVCRDMREQGRDPKQAWPDYAAHWDEVHKPRPYDGQIGTEATPAEWLAALWECTAEWVRVLKPEGSLFVNLGDKYSSGAGPQTGQKSEALRSTKHGHGGGSKWAVVDRQAAVPGFAPKSLLGLPWRYALGCMDRLGLILRAEIVWSKPNGLPESVTDRVRRAHEQVFHFTRQPRYYAAVDEIREPHARLWDSARANGRTGHGRGTGAMLARPDNPNGGMAVTEPNPLGKLPGSVWEIPSAPLVVPARLGVDHFAAFPPALVRPIVLGWSPPGICTACGEGRRPVSQVTSIEDRKGRKQRIIDYSLDAAHGPDGRGGERWKSTAAITGYACACPEPSAPTRPARVVDPFGGTGTVGLVASVYGRLGIVFDLSMDYCRLSNWRTHDPGERARARELPKPPPAPVGMEPLFEMGAT